MIWFTADQHLDHYRIIEIMKRPFKSLDEMGRTIIDNFNQVVATNDTVYHLGDFAFKNVDIWAGMLRGRNHLILGNHDQKRLSKLHPFDSVQDVKYLRWEGYRFFLSHYAHRTWRNSHHGSFHLFGHSHGMMPNYHRSMDVGVDVLDFKPIAITEVIDRLKDAGPVNHHPEVRK